MSKTTVTTGPDLRALELQDPMDLTADELLHLAEARGVAPSTVLEGTPIARGNALIQPASECDLHQISVLDPTPTESDWAEGNLEGLKTLVQNTRVTGDAGKVRISQDATGRWWRFGGNIDLRQVDGVYRFMISLYRGANWDDYEWLQRVIDRAKSGAFLNAGWEKYTDRHGNDAYAWRCGRSYARAGEASTFDTLADLSPEVMACTDPRCLRLIHETLSSTHVAEETSDGPWMLSVLRYVGRDGEDEEYMVNVHVSDSLDAEDLSSFMNHLALMQESCRRANAKAAA